MQLRSYRSSGKSRSTNVHAWTWKILKLTPSSSCCECDWPKQSSCWRTASLHRLFLPLDLRHQELAMGPPHISSYCQVNKFELDLLYLSIFEKNSFWNQLETPLLRCPTAPHCSVAAGCFAPFRPKVPWTASARPWSKLLSLIVWKPFVPNRVVKDFHEV